MKKRIKATSFSSHEEFYDAIDAIAKLSVTLRRQEAYRDEALQNLRGQYERSITTLTENVERLVGAAEKYAEENRSDLLPGKAKSTDTALATFGFRTGMPALKTLSKKWTWDKVLAALIERNLRDFIRQKEEVNKEKLLAIGDKDAITVKTTDEEISVPLALVGVKIVQEETFYIEPKDTAAAS